MRTFNGGRDCVKYCPCNIFIRTCLKHGREYHCAGTGEWKRKDQFARSANSAGPTVRSAGSGRPKKKNKTMAEGRDKSVFLGSGPRCSSIRSKSTHTAHQPTPQNELENAVMSRTCLERIAPSPPCRHILNPIEP